MKNEPGMAFNMKTLNKVFAVISVIFLFSVLWVILDDFIRPWKVVQIKSMEVKQKVLNEKIKAAEKSIDGKKVRNLKEKISKQHGMIAAKQKEIDGLNTKLSDNLKLQYIQKMKNGESGSKAGEYQFNYEHYHVEHKDVLAAKYKKLMNKQKSLFAAGKDQLKTYEAAAKVINKKIKKITTKKSELEKELSGIVGAKDRMVASLSSTSKGPIWAMRNSPFLDFLDPTLKIEQIEVHNVTEDRYFRQVPRVDRCKTCHTFIDKAGFESQENPYKTHPKLQELAVGANSKHPYKLFGCTGCHQGEGHRVFDFNSPIHMPNNEKQKKDWITKYHWHAPHKKPQPMFPLKYTEAGCVKCHSGVQRLPMAANLNKGRELIETYGCYGCHKIEGWQHLEKPGPSLVKIAAKTNPEWIKNWVWSPHSFNPKSKMPAFFNQINNKQSKHRVKNVAEVNAIATFLVEKSKSSKPFMKYSGGNADKGKELITTIGCIGCHQVEGIDESMKVGSRKGTYITGTGSKVNKDWLVSWLKKPSHYDPTSIMPSFRLSDREANDITAYLMSLKNASFEELEFDSMDKKVRDDLLVEYFSQFDPMASGKARLAKLTDHERTMELGKRSIGKYGCYSCHSIDGFAPGRAPIGPELTNLGSKPIHQFGYGQQHHNVGHTRHAWLTAHLKNPRIWDKGVPKPFKDLNRMPNFYLTDEEIQPMVTALVGQVMDYVPLAGQKVLNASEKVAELGKQVVAKYNCEGCHKVDGRRGDILKVMEDNGPPYLVKQGHRVNSDWFYDFLKNVHPIRSYVTVRMPSFNFSNEEINKIIAYFQAESNQPSFQGRPDFVNKNGSVKWEAGEKAAAKQMWDELACTSCHTGGFNRDEAQAPDLHYIQKRLRPDWIENVWLKQPTMVMDNTVMPDFWGEGGVDSAVEGVLDDDPKKQRRAIMKYLWEISFNRSPAAFPYQPTNVGN